MRKISILPCSRGIRPLRGLAPDVYFFPLLKQRGYYHASSFRRTEVLLPKMPNQLTTLYRPVGQAELDLIRASGFRRFPPRLPEQPFFYPVLNEEYATQIARDWNANDASSGFVGYVMRFPVSTDFLNNYEIHTVGAPHHREYWIPAEELDEFNENIAGLIEIVSEFRNEK